MPNRTVNTLDITGDKTQLDNLLSKIYKDNDTPTLDFNGTVPTPEGIEDWYNWAKSNWGVKWNAANCQKIEEIENGARLTFNTAWWAPTKWLHTTSLLYPNLKFLNRCRFEGGEGCARFEYGFDDNGDSYASEEDMPEHDWNMEFDSCYREEYTLITEGEYNDLIQHFSNYDLNYESLCEPLLNRVSDKDLPLFINFEWFGCEDKYQARLKGENTDEN